MKANLKRLQKVQKILKKISIDKYEFELWDITSKINDIIKNEKGE